MSAATSRFAYVSLLMKDASYLPGVRALANSIRASGSKHDYVLLLTDDVKMTEPERKELEACCDKVVKVEKITCKTSLISEVQKTKYSSWINDSLTKWRCLGLTEYSKVFFLDLDVVVVKNIDYIFDMACPAGVFANPAAFPFSHGRGALFNPYYRLSHGDKVSYQAILEGFGDKLPESPDGFSGNRKSFVVTASAILLEPSQSKLSELLAMVEDLNSKNAVFGSNQCYSGGDEQMITRLYIDTAKEKSSWRIISQSFNMIPWHEKHKDGTNNFLPLGDEVAIYHYFGDKEFKPWKKEAQDKYDDVKKWVSFYKMPILKKGAKAPNEINKELHRELLYRRIKHELIKVEKHMDVKDIKNMMLRYRFIVNPKADDDPIFITTTSPEADAQWIKDCEHFKTITPPAQFLQIFKDLLADARQNFLDYKALPDMVPEVRDGRIHYGSRSYRDIKNLSQIDAHKAFALHIRYDYLGLDTLGLARLYEKDARYNDKDSATEAFASAFNHYYNDYHSAFPDLEAVFGSKGSFYNAVNFSKQVVHLNPPFDETIFRLAKEKVDSFKARGSNATFIFTVPDWRDFPTLDELKTNAKSWKRYEKNELPFYNSATDEIQYPVEIVEIDY